MEKVLAIILAVPAVILGIVFLSFLMSYPLYLAWNYVMPDLFALKAVTWTQAWALGFVGTALLKSSSTK